MTAVWGVLGANEAGGSVGTFISGSRGSVSYLPVVLLTVFGIVL
jgi:hypothetical protein